MNTMDSNMNPTVRICPACLQPLPADAPQGLCPQCLAKSALGTQPGSEETLASGSKPGGSGPAAIQMEISRLFPQLEIMEPLGQGGMGMVYKARQPQLDRIVALKVMRADLSRDPAFAERFAREARALAKLNHPNIVSVFDFGQSGGHCWILMEFVDGTNLRELLRTKTLQPREALGIVPKVCDALQYAHDEGIVHRDIKPENILLDKKGRVKIADFGLAKLVGKDASEFSLTATGMTLGTPRYMAPEQFDKPQEVDHRADIYSLGVVLYEMLTGEVPMGRFSLPSATVGVDVRLDEIVLRTLEKEPSRRYQHVSEVKTQVENVTSIQPVAPAPSNESQAPSQPSFRQQDAMEILSLVMVILMGLAALTSVAAVIGLARVLVPALRTDMAVGPVETLGRDALGFVSLLVLSLLVLFLLPKAKRQGRDRLARNLAVDLVVAGGLLTLLCERHWFGLALPYWVGGLVSVTAFICWIILRGQDVRAAFTSRPEQASPGSSEELRAKLRIAGIGLIIVGIINAFAGMIWVGHNVSALTDLWQHNSPWGWQFAQTLISLGYLVVLYYQVGVGIWLMNPDDDGDPTFVLVMSALGPPGCVLGLPVAIYAFMQLTKPEGKALLATLRAKPEPVTAATEPGKPLDHRVSEALAVGLPGWFHRRAGWMQKLLSVPLILVIAFAALAVAGGGYSYSFEKLPGDSTDTAVAKLHIGGPSPWVTAVFDGHGSELAYHLGASSVWFGLAGVLAMGILGWLRRTRPGTKPEEAALQQRIWWAVVLIPMGVVFAVSIVGYVNAFRAVQDSKLSRGRAAAVTNLGNITNGIAAQFTVPAGQVAVFELVTRSNGVTVPIPNFSAYVLAPTDQASAGTFRLLRGPEDMATGVRRRPWTIEVVTPGGKSTSGGLDLPPTLDTAVGGMGINLGLRPNQESIDWQGATPNNLPANGLIGLRVRTLAHGIKGGEPGSSGKSGAATTNWQSPSASSAATDLLRKVTEKYGKLSAFSATGKIVSHVVLTNGGAPTTMSHTFSLNLARPEFYRVAWTNTIMPGVTMAGAAWSAGEGHKVLMNDKVSTLLNREQALAMATGISGGVAHTVPSLFFKDDAGRLLKTLSNAALLPDETLGKDLCHVITGDGLAGKYTLWITKKDSFLKQFRTAHVAKSAKPDSQSTEDLSDESIKKILKMTGQEATPDMVSKVRQMRATSGKMAASVQITTTETFERISVDELMIKEDFEVAVPSGAAAPTMPAAKNSPARGSTQPPQVKNQEQPIFYTFSGVTRFTRGPDGPQLLKAFADELKLNELQTAEVNKIIPRYYRDFVALERQHTTFSTDATGQVQITITPFAADTIALAKRMNAEIRGTIGKEILYPDLPGNLVIFGLFRHCGEVEIKTKLWKEGGLYRFEEKQGPMTFPGGGMRSGASRSNSGKDWKWAFPEEYWVYWNEK